MTIDTKVMLWKYLEGSVTRLLEYLFNIWPFKSNENLHHMFLSKVGSIFLKY